jgi:hypothetical protein
MDLSLWTGMEKEYKRGIVSAENRTANNVKEAGRRSQNSGAAAFDNVDIAPSRHLLRKVRSRRLVLVRKTEATGKQS